MWNYSVCGHTHHCELVPYVWVRWESSPWSNSQSLIAEMSSDAAALAGPAGDLPGLCWHRCLPCSQAHSRHLDASFPGIICNEGERTLSVLEFFIWTNFPPNRIKFKVFPILLNLQLNFISKWITTFKEVIVLEQRRSEFFHPPLSSSTLVFISLTAVYILGVLGTQVVER